MGFESSQEEAQMYTTMETNHQNNHRNSRKASIKVAWEESYAQKTEELRAEERRQSNLSGSPTVSSSFTSDVSVVQRPSPFSLRRILNIFRSKRFADRNLENLYRRYFIKVDQSSMSVMNIICIILCCMLLAFAYSSGHTNPLRGIVLGIIIALFVLLEVLLYRICLERGAQQVMCYLSLLLLLGVVCTISIDLQPSSVDNGFWVTVYFVYMVYTGIPVNLCVAVLAGILLPLFQVALTSRFSFQFLYTQSEVSSNTFDKYFQVILAR
ncbi:adenylate cyclase [Plakobranchus ocellatus]|uniref:Adenylate cyclase n=1 Tax=Plakobranchus ocellatus TaxID=259542 RepID=A0AAV4D156_9GAST|nr:adenylate cyclase [Plakobranchus ocellatus]